MIGAFFITKTYLKKIGKKIDETCVTLEIKTGEPLSKNFYDKLMKLVSDDLKTNKK